MAGKTMVAAWMVGGAAIIISMYMLAQFMAMQLTMKL
jgi:hypothetical protein